jgi:hypothetical protein
MRWFLTTGGLVIAGVLWGVFYYRFCNVPQTSPDQLSRKIDAAIARGLDFEFESGAFQKRLDAGGEHIIHHFLLGLVLAKAPHPRLKAQMEYCDRNSQDVIKWRSFTGLPGWAARPLSDDDRTSIQSLLREDHAYGHWLLWAVHASWAKLEPADYHALFEDTSGLKNSYDLTHALLAYWLVEQTAPDVAKKLAVNQRIAEVIPRIKRYASWAPRCSDGYNERVAFLLLLSPPPEISPRWIERILASQNANGGWSWFCPYYRTGLEMLGRHTDNYASAPHPTFLALIALTYYRDQLRSTNPGSGDIK